MSKEEKRIELAKLDGITQRQLTYSPGFEIAAANGEILFADTDPSWYWPQHVLPNYLESYDAIIPLIKKQTIWVKDMIKHSAKEKFGIHVLSMTAEQMADSLLEALGKLPPK